MSNKTGRDAALLTVAKIISLIISLISAMLLSRFRTLDEYGTYSQLILLSTLATSIFTLGLPNSTNYFLARAELKEDRKNFLSFYYTINTIICLVIGITLTLTVPLSAAYFKNAQLSLYTFFLAIFPWTNIIISSINNVLVVYGKTKKLMLINIINTSIVLLSIIIVKILNWSFKEYLIVYLCGELCIMVWVYVIVSKLEGRLHFLLNKDMFKSILKFSIPIGIAVLIGTINIEIDKLMIGKFFNTESLAIYSNASKELPLTIVASSFTAVLLPQLANRLKNNDVDGAITLWGHATNISYIIICFFSMICIVFAPNIISILYSNKYLPGVNVFRIYSFVMLLRVTYFGIILNSLGKTKFIFYSSLLSMVLNVVLNYLFYLAFGYIGPAVATLISIGAVGSFQLIVTAKLLHIKFRKLMPWNSLLQVTIINIAFGLVTYILLTFMKIETTVKGNIIAFIVGFVIMLIYTLIVLKRVKQLWRELNAT